MFSDHYPGLYPTVVMQIVQKYHYTASRRHALQVSEENSLWFSYKWQLKIVLNILT